MSRFRYLRDPLFLLAIGSYLLNCGWLRSRANGGFLHNQFNDLLLIPAALPVVLWVQRLTGLRRHDAPPSWLEMAFHVGVWSVVCEFAGPWWLHAGTADPWDVGAYLAGGLVACVWWHCSGPKQPAVPA